MHCRADVQSGEYHGISPLPCRHADAVTGAFITCQNSDVARLMIRLGLTVIRCQALDRRRPTTATSESKTVGRTASILCNAPNEVTLTIYKGSWLFTARGAEDYLIWSFNAVPWTNAILQAYSKLRRSVNYRLSTWLHPASLSCHTVVQTHWFFGVQHGRHECRRNWAFAVIRNSWVYDFGTSLSQPRVERTLHWKCW